MNSQILLASVFEISRTQAIYPCSNYWIFTVRASLADRVQRAGPVPRTEGVLLDVQVARLQQNAHQKFSLLPGVYRGSANTECSTPLRRCKFSCSKQRAIFYQRPLFTFHALSVFYLTTVELFRRVLCLEIHFILSLSCSLTIYRGSLINFPIYGTRSHDLYL